jgi:hypothetical protein
MIKKFETGKIYFTRSIGDHNCIIEVKVLDRTANTITAYDEHSKTNRKFRIRIIDNFNSNGDPCETIKPWGSYSMSPTLSADKLLIKEAA